MFTLRSATRADFPAIRKLVWAARLNPTGLAWRRFLIAVNSTGDLIACGQVNPHFDGSRELASIVVARAWRNQGVARALITRLLQCETGAVYLTCRAELSAFYQRFGFRRLDQPEMPAYFRRLYGLARITRTLLRLPGELIVMVKDKNP